jgi:hypothetical protein
MTNLALLLRLMLYNIVRLAVVRAVMSRGVIGGSSAEFLISKKKNIDRGQMIDSKSWSVDAECCAVLLCYFIHFCFSLHINVRVIITVDCNSDSEAFAVCFYIIEIRK